MQHDWNGRHSLVGTSRFRVAQWREAGWRSNPEQGPAQARRLLHVTRAAGDIERPVKFARVPVAFQGNMPTSKMPDGNVYSSHQVR